LITQGYKIEEPNHFNYISNDAEEIILLKEEIISGTQECKDIINKSIQDYYSLKYFLSVYKILPTTEYLKKKGYINILQKPLDEKYSSPRKQVKPSTPEPELIITKVKRPKTIKILVHQKEKKEKKEKDKEKKEKKTRKTRVIIPDKISPDKSPKSTTKKIK
jgi:hypothetical protein